MFFPKSYTWMWLAGIPIILFYDRGYDPFGKSQEWDHCLWRAAKPRSQNVQRQCWRSLLSRKQANQQDILEATNRLHFTSSPRDQEKVAQQVYCPVTRTKTKTKPKNNTTKTPKNERAEQMMCGSCKLLSIIGRQSPTVRRGPYSLYKAKLVIHIAIFALFPLPLAQR